MLPRERTGTVLGDSTAIRGETEKVGWERGLEPRSPLFPQPSALDTGLREEGHFSVRLLNYSQLNSITHPVLKQEAAILSHLALRWRSSPSPVYFQTSAVFGIVR